MLIYEGTKDKFLMSVEQDLIAIEIENNINIGNTIMDTMSIEITDNFNEKINIENKNKVGSNVNLTEII